MFIEKSCEEFLDQLASKQSVPGGGGAAAMVGALAAALTSMVCNFTIGKKKYEQVQDKMQALLTEAESLRAKLQELVQDDAVAFNALMAVYKLPKETEEEQSLRKSMLQDKAKAAAMVPMEICRAAVAVQKLAIQALQDGNSDLASDAILAGILGRAALRSAYYNVLINLPITQDSEWNNRVKGELAELSALGEQLESEITKLGEPLFGN